MTDEGTFTIGDTGLRVILHDRLVIVAGNGMTDEEIRLCSVRGVALLGCSIEDVPIRRFEFLEQGTAYLVDVNYCPRRE